ncbi:MAG: 50S ribosomal protein L31e [Candidatus Heimdallarchaeota archaeon LC_3]|nr:MAG: 50S ribosomal protein L31e [Candidatus Heimdallarchaeota archaeon LC_3]
MSEDIKDLDSEIIDQRTVTISFSKPVYGDNVPRRKRTPHALKYLKNIIQRHWDVDNVIIDPEVNRAIWKRGIQYPPRKITVKIIKSEEDSVEVFLAD